MCVCAAVVAEKLPCLTGKRPKRVFLDVSEDVLMSFCVAGVALCDIRCVSAGMCVCVCLRSRREGKVGVSMGKATKTCLPRPVSGHVVLRPGVALCDIWVRFRRNACARPS